MSGCRQAPAGGRGAILGVAIALALGTGAVAVENPTAELAEALRGLGPPGVLWGRLAVEEESPDGAWTPLSGVEVEAYPAIPSLSAELERIRQSARGSGAEYESAVGRLQAAFAAHRVRVRAATAGVDAAGEPAGSEPPAITPAAKAPPKAARSPVGVPGEEPATSAAAAANDGRRRRMTDTAGLFIFDDLPSGEWVIVATRITAYGASKARPPAKAPSSRRTAPFLTGPPRTAKEAEIWITRVRFGPGERVALLLTERARWMVGPVY